MDEALCTQPGSSGPAAPGRAESATGLGGRRPGRPPKAAMAAALPRDDPHPCHPPITVDHRSSDLLSPSGFFSAVARAWRLVPSLNRPSGRGHGGYRLASATKGDCLWNREKRERPRKLKSGPPARAYGPQPCGRGWPFARPQGVFASFAVQAFWRSLADNQETG
jgi:hypothetical protein